MNIFSLDNQGIRGELFERLPSILVPGKQNIIIVAGYQGSGKSTLVKNLREYVQTILNQEVSTHIPDDYGAKWLYKQTPVRSKPPFPITDVDPIFLPKTQRTNPEIERESPQSYRTRFYQDNERTVDEMIRSGKSFIVEALDHITREKWVELAKDQQANLIMIWLLTKDMEINLSRIKERTMLSYLDEDDRAALESLLKNEGIKDLQTLRSRRHVIEDKRLRRAWQISLKEARKSDKSSLEYYHWCYYLGCLVFSNFFNDPRFNYTLAVDSNDYGYGLYEVLKEGKTIWRGSDFSSVQSILHPSAEQREKWEEAMKYYEIKDSKRRNSRIRLVHAPFYKTGTTRYSQDRCR
jgi:predicted kinase